MGVTITVNGLSLIHQASNGASTATLPNVCHTPSAGPIPYGSVALSRDLAGGTHSVRVDGGHSAATARSVFACSTGDEAGVQGGVVSGVRGAESSFLTFSPDVRLEGSPAARLTDKMLNNHGNTVNAGGDTNDVAKASRARPTRTQAEKVLVTVLGEDGKRAHGPFTVILKPVKKGKGRKYRQVTRKGSGAVVFHNVEKARYRVIVSHDCYPEGIAERTVDSRIERIEVKLARVDLKAVAGDIRVGVHFSNPTHYLGALGQFHDIVTPAFWQRYEAAQFDPSKPENWIVFAGNAAAEIVAPVQVAQAVGLGVEVTPLVWIYGFKGDVLDAATNKTIPWSPNPIWLKPIGDPALAMPLVKSFITKVANAFKNAGVLEHVRRWVVINEPMNILMRDITRESPFLNALMPTAADKTYARKDVAAIVRKNKKAKHKSTVPKVVKLTQAAIDNMVEILKHAHAELPGNAYLIVNDYGIEGYDEKKGLSGMRGYRFRQLMKGIVAGVKNVPGLLPRLRVGLQAHLKSGGELTGGGGERNDFTVASIRKQMRWFKDQGLRICVTECDMVLGEVAYKVKVKGKKKKVKKDALHEHIAAGSDLHPDGGRTRKDGFDDGAFYTAKIRRRPYLRAFAAQRLDLRDTIAAILGQRNVDSFVWWSFNDDLPEDAGGTNFRYHGYLFHQHLVCKQCQGFASMQVPDDNKTTYYKKPCYWGTVAAFQSPGARFAR